MPRAVVFTSDVSSRGFYIRCLESFSSIRQELQDKRSSFSGFIFIHFITRRRGHRHRREEGGSCPPWNISAPSLGDLCPPWELYSEPNKRSRKSAKTSFLENTYFWDKNAVQISIKILSIWRSRFCPRPKIVPRHCRIYLNAVNNRKEKQLHHIFTSYYAAQVNPVSSAKDHGANNVC